MLGKTSNLRQQGGFQLFGLCLALLGIVSALLLRDDRDRHFLGVERLSKVKIIETQDKPKLDKKVPVDPNSINSTIPITFTHILIVWYLAVTLPGMKRHNAFCCLDWGNCDMYHLTSHPSAQILFCNKMIAQCKKRRLLTCKILAGRPPSESLPQPTT